MTPSWPSKIRRLPSLACFLIAAAAAITLLPYDARAEGVFDAIGSQVNKVFEDAKGAVVRVRAGHGEFETAGSGFFIDEKGTVLTAAAILGADGAATVSVEVNGIDLPAKVLGLDTRSGIAVLQIFNGRTPRLTLAPDDDIRTATPVVGIGYPFNLPAAPTFGMITGFDTQYLNHFFATTHLRTSLAISPGQIGGPVLNGRGQVAGMLVMAADERKFTYALPSAAIGKILADLNLHGRIVHGWVGVGVNPHSEDKEVRITQLFDGTPAALSGLQPGDVVVRVDKREIVRPSDVIDASFFSRVGEEIPVVVARKGQLLTFKFTVGERPERIPLPLPANPESPLNPPGPQTMTVGSPGSANPK